MIFERVQFSGAFEHLIILHIDVELRISKAWIK